MIIYKAILWLYLIGHNALADRMMHYSLTCSFNVYYFVSYLVLISLVDNENLHSQTYYAHKQESK